MDVDDGDGDVPGPAVVDVDVDVDVEVGVEVGVEVEDALDAVVVVFLAEDGAVESLGVCRIPATARFCCAETWGPVEHAETVQASAATMSDMSPLLPVRCRVGPSFPAPRAGQGRARTTQRKQRKNRCGKGPGSVG